jgi:hypothetical protein
MVKKRLSESESGQQKILELELETQELMSKVVEI